jgi:dihydroflavonol-4-reductase
MPAFIDTGLNLVDVRDVATGHLLAAEKGRAGERYILGCENLTLEQILQKLAGLTGRKAPTVKLPYAVAYAAGVVTTAWARVSGNPPRVPIDAVKMARKKMFVSHAKAVRELGFAPGNIDAALQRAIDWFSGHGYC